MNYQNIKAELHAILVIIGGGLSLFYGALLPLMVFGIIAFIVMWWQYYSSLNGPNRSIGVANSITLARLSLLVLVSSLYQFIDPVLYGICVLIVIIADGLDGYFARKYNEESAFGAAFDMETDAFLAAVLTTLIYMQIEIGIWIVAAGFLRYIFVLARRLFGLHRVVTPHMAGAKLLAVLFFISLILPFLFPSDFTIWGLMAGAALVSFSFGREFVLIVQKKLFGDGQ